MNANPHFPDTAIDWIRRSVGEAQRPLDIQPMKGSTSSSVYLVKWGGDSGPKFVLRVLDNSAWLADEPDLAEHEAAALVEARRAGLRSPELVAHSREEVGFGAPAVLMSYVEGRIELKPADVDRWLDALAAELAAIHRHPAQGYPWTYRTWSDRTVKSPPAWSGVPHRWVCAMELIAAGEPPYEPCFIHRDYHPMNVLWEAGSISGVVDWINACRGPSSVDVAHCRTNLAAMFGSDAAAQFLEAYLAAGGQPFDPYWDIDSLLDMAFPSPAWYPPWNDFGCPDIGHEALCARMDAHLARVLEPVW